MDYAGPPVLIVGLGLVVIFIAVAGMAAAFKHKPSEAEKEQTRRLSW